MNNKRIFILLGPSGAGKTTLGGYLKELGIPELVSHTTRPMREGEVDGISYYFVSKEEFDTLEKDEFSNYGGSFYCLSKKEIENKFKDYDTVFAITDINGVKQLKEKYPEIKVIFITIPLEEMEKRMRDRKDTEENIQKRLRNAIENKEHDNIKYADYVIENFDLEVSKQKIRDIVFGEKFERSNCCV